ncbi:MAG: type IX secretion system sortase PorU [Fidelibacterota bacterium]
MFPLNRYFAALILISHLFGGISVQVIKSTPEQLVISVKTDPQVADDLKSIQLLVGLPTVDYPVIRFDKQTALPTPFSPVNKVIEQTRWLQRQELNGLFTATLNIVSVTGQDRYFPEQTITISFPRRSTRSIPPTTRQEQSLSTRIINWQTARQWINPAKRPRLAKTTYPKGTWLKFSVNDDGVRKISALAIQSALGTGAVVDPRSFFLYTGTSLGRDRTFVLTQSVSNESSVPENLTEIAIQTIGAEDGSLDSGDEIRFWARGASGFDQSGGSIGWHQNLYFTSNTYWLLIPDDSSLRGQRIQTTAIEPNSLVILTYGLAFLHYEEDRLNPMDTGLGWVNSQIQSGGSFRQTVHLVQPEPSVPINGTAGFQGGEIISTRYGNTQHEISITYNNSLLGTVRWSNLGQKKTSFLLTGSSATAGDQDFEFTNTATNPNSSPYYDYLTLSYGRGLTTEEGSFDFYAPITANRVTFSITDDQSFEAWDITRSANPEQVPLVVQDDQTVTLTKTLPSDTLAHFIIFDPQNIAEIENLILVGDKDFTRLRNTTPGVEHLIIGPEEFSAAAEELVQHRKSSRFISIEQVYDEFSGGNPDPVAIRHFIRWTQEQWTEPHPGFVLLMGDGDYDYRNISGRSRIFVPTIEVGILDAYATDDRLVAYNGVLPEVAVGRFPAASSREVSDFVSKIIAFETEPVPGVWRQTVTLVADDPARPERELFEINTGKSHTINSEHIASLIPNFMAVKKLYMVDYPEVSDGSAFGVTKPEATEALFNTVREGTSIVNFIGHGNPKQWAQEKLLLMSDSRNDVFNLITEMKLPIWIAGTCNWGHFDQLQEDSFAEALIRVPMDGASAVITTTRGITVSGNILYLDRIFNALFPGGTVTAGTVGNVIQSMKTGGRDGELFHLFGDPQMPIPIPGTLITDAQVSPDSLATLELGKLSGSNPVGVGKGFLTFEDGFQTVVRKYNFLSTVQEIAYKKTGPILFRGQYSTATGTFSTDFRVPKDITYSPNSATVRFILEGENRSEALGAVGNLTLSPGVPSTDTQGPIISFETESKRSLRSGDHLKSGEKIFIRLSDPLGINITGETGHELMLSDLTSAVEKEITSYFIYDLNSITTGTIPYKIADGSETVSLKVRAWDNANNPAEQSVTLDILSTNNLTLLHVLNFPNPFSTFTQFTFEITAAAEIRIDIYTLEGRKIKSIDPEFFSVGYHTIQWDGRDAFGGRLANGVYLYRIKATGAINSVTFIGRLAKFQ